MTSSDTIVFILVSPQMGENIGAAARAMANFGLCELRLVTPRDGWPNQTADSMASGAFDRMNEICVYDSLSDALADVHFAYATTARSRDMEKAISTPRQAAIDSIARDAQRVAFVFGPERTGLENDDVALCHSIINVPTQPDFASLNLAQCVLLSAYEISIARQGNAVHEGPLPASMDVFDGFFDRLDRSLEESGFFREENLRPKVTRNMRSMLLRGSFTEQEVKTLHGVLSALRGNKES